MMWFLLREDPQGEIGPLAHGQQNQIKNAADALEDIGELGRTTTNPIEVQREELHDLDGQPISAEALARRVMVRAELTTVYSEQGHAPKNCKGWTVTAQSWIEETAQVERYTAVANRHGVAEFQFPDYVHIDWVRCVPPAGSGYGIAYLEDHEDIYAGDHYLALLHVLPKRSAVGRVMDWSNQPLAGVEVHAFGEFGDNGLEEWTPGLATTTTDSNGRFEFQQLTVGDWNFSVLPERWMMYEPELGNQGEGFGNVFIDEDVAGVADAGTLRVMPMTTVELQVVDRRGEPAPGVSGYVKIQHFDSPRLRNPDEDWIDEEEEEGAPFNPNAKLEWPYGGISFITDQNGQATLRIAHGQWVIEFDAFIGDFPGIYELPKLEFHADVGKLFYSLPVAVGSLKARVVLENQRPAVGAYVALAYEEEGDIYEMEQECAADGSFEFTALDLSTAYTMQVYPDLDGNSVMFYPQTWAIDPEADRGRDFVVKSAKQTKLRLNRIDGNRSFEKINARIDLTNWEAGDTSFDLADGTWWQEAELWSHEATSKRNLQLPPMPEGFATLEMKVAQPTGSWNKYGYSRVRMESIQTWRIKVEGSTVPLDVDLHGYEAPPRNSTHHHGVVVNAESGEAITDGMIVFYCEQGAIQTRVNSAKEFSFYSVADIGSIHIHAPGHVTLVVPSYAYKPDKHEHRFELQASAPAFELLVLDRLGEVVSPESLHLLGERNENLMEPPTPPIAPDPLPGMEVFGDQYGSPIPPSTPRIASVFPSQHASARVVAGVRPGRIKALATFAEDVTAEGWFTAPIDSHSLVEVRLNKSQAEINQEIIDRQQD
ncbi:MAG: carboxypeptidase regulatory-like domain-containing protein [Planctomycetes bacterium]|nr:carboxypeptidase regulatory-like domain-containing protein [Planctomycetota bacterium]